MSYFICRDQSKHDSKLILAHQEFFVIKVKEYFKFETKP